ncbi:MAG: glycosyltransferase family 9 protein [archaeon]
MGITLTKCIDRVVIGGLVGLLSLLRRKKIVPTQPRRILLIQLWGIGETVCVLPALFHLRRHFPTATIDMLCTPRNKAVFSGNRDLSDVHVIEPGARGVLGWVFSGVRKTGRYDVVIDMEEYLNVSAVLAWASGHALIGYAHGLRGKVFDKTVKYRDDQHVVHTFEDLLVPLGITDHAHALPPLNFSEADLRAAKRVLASAGVDTSRFIVIVPGAAETARSRIWPWKRFGSLARKLHRQEDVTVVVTGSKSERELAGLVQTAAGKGTVSIAGKLNLTELYALIKLASLVVSNDTGPMHIGAAMGTPTVGLFGPNLPTRFGPFGEDNVGIYKEGSCRLSPCLNVHLGQTPDCLYPKNSADYQKCMKAISVDDVLKEAKRLLS